MSYGSLTQADVMVLEEVLLTLIAQGEPNIFSLKISEVGIHNGQTARGIKEFLELRRVAVDYWCVDNGAQSDLIPPFAGAKMVNGDSAEVYVQIPSLDLAFIDGCHCRNHVVLDTLNFGERVKRFGFMLFHDTSPLVQRTMRDPHGPDHSDFYNSVNAAHELINFPTPEWQLFREAFDPAANIGGIKAFRKL